MSPLRVDTIEKYFKRRWPFAVILILFSLLISIFLIRQGGSLHKETIDKKRDLEILLLSAQNLKKLWHFGDLNSMWKSGKFKCPLSLGSPGNVDDEYLRCNPGFIDCWFKHQKSIVVVKDRVKHSVFAREWDGSNKPYRVVAKSLNSGRSIPDFGIELELYLKNTAKTSMRVILSDTCKNTYLPKKVYAIGKYQSGGADWNWDNFDRDIYVDKFMVTLRDVIEWAESAKIPLGKLNITGGEDELFAPAYGLSIEEMQNYCAFRAKQLLTAHIFDAATFHPGKLSRNSLRVMRGPYPESRKSKKSFLYRAKREASFVLNKSDCKKAYVYECLQLAPFEHYDTASASWIGIFQVMGGHLEVFNNPLAPEKNLKASSYYFDLKSDWHQLGARAFWNGEGSEVSNFFWDKKGPKEDKHSRYKVGFRCMRFR